MLQAREMHTMLRQKRPSTHAKETYLPPYIHPSAHPSAHPLKTPMVKSMLNSAYYKQVVKET